MHYIQSVIDRSDVDELAYIVANAYEPDLRKKMDTQTRNLNRHGRARKTVLVMSLLVLLAVALLAICVLNQFVEGAIAAGVVAAAIVVITPVVRSRQLREVTHTVAPLELSKAYWRVTLLPAGERSLFVVDPQASDSNQQTVRLGQMEVAALQDPPQIAKPAGSAGLEQDQSALATLSRMAATLRVSTNEITLAMLRPDLPNGRALEPALSASKPATERDLHGAAIWPSLPDATIERFAQNTGQLLAFAERPFGVDSQALSTLFNKTAGYVQDIPSVLRQDVEATALTRPTPAAGQSDQKPAIPPLEKEIDRLFVAVISSLRTEVQADIEALDANLERGQTNIQLKTSQRKDEVMRRQDDELGRVQAEIAALGQELGGSESKARSTQDQLVKIKGLLDKAESQARTAEQSVTANEIRLVDLKSQLEQVQRRLHEASGDPRIGDELAGQVRQQERLLNDQQAALQQAQADLTQAKVREADLKQQMEAAERQVKALVQPNPARSSEAERLRQELASLEKQLQKGDDPRLEVRYDKVKEELDKMTSTLTPTPANLQSGQKGQTFRSTTGSLGPRIDLDQSRRKVTALEEQVNRMQQDVSDAKQTLSDLQRRKQETEHLVQQAASARLDLADLESKISAESQEKIPLGRDLMDKQRQRDELRNQAHEAQQVADDCASEVKRLQALVAKSQDNKQSLESATASQLLRIEADTQVELEAHGRPLEAQRQRITEHIEELVDLQASLRSRRQTQRPAAALPQDAIGKTDASLLALRASAVKGACSTVMQALELPRNMMRDAQQFVDRHKWQIDGMAIAARTDVYVPLWFFRAEGKGESWQLVAMGRTWSPQEITSDQHIRVQIADTMTPWIEAFKLRDVSPTDSTVLIAGTISLRDRQSEIAKGLQNLQSKRLISHELVEHIGLVSQPVNATPLP